MTELRVAACQYEPRVGDNAGNLELATTWMARAIDAGAKLIVLPELAGSGYVFASDAEADAAAETLETSPFVHAVTEAARRADVTIVAGFAERVGNVRYNSAVIADASGVRATYHKIHRFYNEQNWFKPGDRTVVVETGWGRLGVLICYDLRFPEVARSMALAGADVIAVPTNWVSAFKPTLFDERGYCQNHYLAMATAAQNGVAVICADRVGVERGEPFIGASLIVGPGGWAVAGPAAQERDELLIADIDLDDVARTRQSTPRNPLLEDRRPDSYNAVVVRQSPQLAAPQPPL
jgi:predicted amidohydrolase